MSDFVALREIGLCELKVGKRYHDLTPQGRVAAMTLEKRLCQTLGIHVKLGGNDNTQGSTHYHVATMVPRPAWAKGVTPTIQIGSHTFYAGVK